LVSGYDVLYGKVKQFVRDELFGRVVDLEDANTLRNLSEIEASRAILEGFKKAINNLSVRQRAMRRFATESS
jgi:type III restriction enzyme